MGDYSVNEVMALIGGGVTALGTIAVGVRKFLRSERIAEAKTDTAVGGQRAGDLVVENLVKEVNRLGAVVLQMRKEIDELKHEIDYVRAAALEGLELAMQCTCPGPGHDQLIEHLKSIIKGPPKKVEP